MASSCLRRLRLKQDLTEGIINAHRNGGENMAISAEAIRANIKICCGKNKKNITISRLSADAGAESLNLLVEAVSMLQGGAAVELVCTTEFRLLDDAPDQRREAGHLPEEDNPAYERALALQDAGILSGFPDGSFGLDRQLTRAESVAVTLRALGVNDEAGKTAYEPIFPDVPKGHWAAGYIIYAYRNGMIECVSGAAFEPERYVTAQEFCALLLRNILNEPDIKPDSVFEWLVLLLPLDINYIDSCFSKNKFLRADMVNVVYELCVTRCSNST